MLCASMNGALETALVTAYCGVMLPCVSAAGPEAEPVVVEASGAIIVNRPRLCDTAERCRGRQVEGGSIRVQTTLHLPPWLSRPRAGLFVVPWRSGCA